MTDQLGLQVRQAVQVLIQSLDRLDATHGRTLLAGTSEKELYNAALTVMMRLVFLFCAEEKGLLLLGNHLYDEHYAVSTLREQLRETADRHGEELLESRHDAWCRLLAIFRAIHGGIEHDELRLPAYGGGLFDPDRYPFLEGRAADTRWQSTPASPLEINNRVVLHLLEALQTLETKLPGTSERQRLRLSFRALDIEQIGHVYEGLLDHTAKRAREVVLGLGGKKGEEPEIPLEKLEELAGGRALDPLEGSSTSEPFLLAADAPADVVPFPAKKGQDSYSPPEPLVEFLHEATGRSKSALKKALMDRSRVDEGKLRIACGNDDSLVARVTPFAGLLREDTFGRPLVFPGGSLYVTSGSDRRSTGTHYTPRSLTEPIVQHTLEPLVYLGPAEGLPKEQWKLKSAKEILALKVCDMAMGSGAFLVQTCRYLAERLEEAWEQTEKAQPGAFITTPEGELSTGSASERLLPADPAERLAIARRYVADRCLYGVDINPMAVEMAKLSLWLITLQRDRPFTFLDHALKCGDSLLGISSVQQIENFSLLPGDRQVTFATANLFRYVDEASAKRRALEDLPSNEHNQIETKNRLHAEAEAATAKVKAIADCLIALELRGLAGYAYENQRTVEAEKVQQLMKRDADASLESQTTTTNQLSAHAREELLGRRLFHWAAEFPEVFARGGFNAFVGNPPFMGGKKITGILGTDYRDLLVNTLAYGQPGVADLSAFFFLRAFSLLTSQSGCLGMIGTNTLAQGDTREVGLEQICENDGISRTASQSHGIITQAISSLRWPGTASLDVCCVWIRRGSWNGSMILDEKQVAGITTFLTARSETVGTPYRLAANSGKSFMGTIPLGRGFVLSPKEAAELLDRSQRNSDVLFPYLNGEDLNTRPDQSPARWIINFFDWPLDREHDDPESPKGPPYASDYPECLERVAKGVKPLRDTQKKKSYRERWWQYAERCARLYEVIAHSDRVLVKTQVSPTWAFALVDSRTIFDQRVIVLCSNPLALLQSSIHWAWSIHYGSTLGKITCNYTPTDCFETFPFPVLQTSLVDIGKRYHECRREIMHTRQEGLTQTYNRFHKRGEQSADIARLRVLQVEMDYSVSVAYGWSDLNLGHGFHATKQGERYTLSEPARRTVLDRLLALNHQRYAEEVKAGLHEKGAKKAKAKKAKHGNAELDFF